MSCIVVFKIKDQRAASGPGYSAVSRPVLMVQDGTVCSKLRIDGPHWNLCMVRCHNMDSWVMTRHDGRNTSVIEQHRSLVLLRSTRDDTSIVHAYGFPIGNLSLLSLYVWRTISADLTNLRTTIMMKRRVRFFLFAKFSPDCRR